MCRRVCRRTALSTMTKYAGILLVALAIGASFFFEVTKGADKNAAIQDIYTASWAVEIMKGGDKMADTIASRYGFQNIGKVLLVILRQADSSI